MAASLALFLTSFQPFPFTHFLLVVVFLILLYRWSVYRRKDSSAPPSPPKLPIIGNLHQLGLLPHQSLHTLSQRHGPVMLLQFGSRPVLVISSADAASQIYKTHDLLFSSRPKYIFWEKAVYNYGDIASAPYGEYWRQLRSICILNLLSNKMVRSYGDVRREETNLMIREIRTGQGQILNLSEIFMKLSFDIICTITMGKKYTDVEKGDAKIFMGLAVELAAFFTRVNIGDYIPWLAWFTRLSGFDAELHSLAKRFDDFMEMIVQEHLDQSTNENEDRKDFIDIMIAFQKENGAGSSFDRIGIKGIMMDVFAAGTDTTFTVLEWAMTELIKNPTTMEKLQNEVRGIVGNKTDINEEDLVEMHYLKAVMKETLRLHPPNPMLLPRIAREDVEINGYYIKANTQILVNAWSIGRNPMHYTNPLCFEPDRFLNSTVDYKGSNFELIPFGAGRRICPGLQFAIAVEEIALCKIVHNFDWALPDGETYEDLDMTETPGTNAHRKNSLKAIATPYICQLRKNTR